MPTWAKFLIGLAAALLAGWLHHGPAGQGGAFLDALEAEARSVVAGSGVPDVTASMRRSPLQRTAILAGPADPFQREGQGSFPGLNERVLAVPGIARVEWANPPPDSGD